MIEEQPEVRALDGFVQVGVGEDDVRALAAQLQSDALQIGLRGGLHDQMADFGGAGERHLIDIHVIGDGGAGGGTESRQHVDDAFGESRLHDQARRCAARTSGVCSAGFITTVFPVASAGASFQASISMGKFQGMIWPTTPTGSCRV